MNCKKWMNKLLCLVMAFTLVLGCLSGCSNTSEQPEDGDVHVSEQPEEESAHVSEEPENGGVRKELTSVELVKLMGNGINLGNTMEAYGHKDPGIKAEVSQYETLWGQPVTTQEMVSGMKQAGFDSLRIPIAWTNVMDYENGDYTIRTDFMDRIEEIVNYALKAEMYVIINDHWDGSWWGMFGSATPETREKAMEMYVAMWKQIAERFKDYSDYLIFESGNEELGDRLNDIDVAEDSGTLSEDQCYETANKINQTFVDTIRASGGNNEQRFLLIAGYNTNIERTCDDRFVMPNDTAEHKLMVSVHYYDPWNYCGADSGQKWGTKKDYEEQNSALKMMSKFTDAGYGVIIGEYAVIPKADGSLKDNTQVYLENFLDNCDLLGYCPMLWDCSQYFLRSELKFVNEELAQFYKDRSYSAQAGKSAEELASAAQERMDNAMAAAPDKFEEQIDLDQVGGAKAWIMFSSQDWSITYSAQDNYDPTSKTDGLEAVDVDVDGAGTYTVSLDFSKTGAGFARGTAFSALAVGNGELLYPGYTIEIKEMKVNGEPYELKAKPYTTSDDGKCTRVNLYNEWVSEVPAEARSYDGDTSDAAATIVDNADLEHVETIEITFDYQPPKD